MIRHAVVFRGAQASTYDSEVQAWAAAHADPDLNRTSGHDEGYLRLDLSRMAPDSTELADAVSDDTSLLLPLRTLILDQVQAQGWNASAVADLVGLLEEADTEWSIAFIVRSGAMPKALEDVATEDVRDRRIDTSSPAAAASWVTGWLQPRGVDLSRPVAAELAEHAGESADSLADAAASLAAAAPAEGRWSPTWPEVEARLGEMGSVPIYRITGAIATGRTEESLEVLSRLLGAAGVHPLAVLSVLTSRYRNYALVVDAGVDATEACRRTGVKPGAARYLLSEARTLGPVRLVRALGHIAAAESDLKGPLSKEGTLVLETLVLALTRQVATAKAARR